MPFQLPPLPYPSDAMEPFIDKMTMEIHHGKHHGGYVRKPQQGSKGNCPIFRTSRSAEAAPRTTSRSSPRRSRRRSANNGRGHYNHSDVLAPARSQKTQWQTHRQTPAKAIRDSTFGSFEKFKEQLNAPASMGRFGSGWAWLIKSAGKIDIVSTPNQDNPVMDNKYPILGVDVWEHAYYLKYQNRRADYLAAWWNLVNWQDVENRFNKGNE